MNNKHLNHETLRIYLSRITGIHKQDLFVKLWHTRQVICHGLLESVAFLTYDI